MDEKADLLEKVQELEHICQQLSAETETIGIKLASKSFKISVAGLIKHFIFFRRIYFIVSNTENCFEKILS
jgi:hypothetical protein